MLKIRKGNDDKHLGHSILYSGPFLLCLSGRGRLGRTRWNDRRYHKKH